ncbi:MAG: hypothetical protein M1374_05170 [Firmicutes bacterium]|nr:hypothetical protein [Bacillota bacterium]
MRFASLLRSRPATSASDSSWAAIEIIIASESYTSGGSGSQQSPFISKNIISDAQAARLLPSGRGWFQVSLDPPKDPIKADSTKVIVDLIDYEKLG